jgi:hypothetical protein
MRTSTKNMCCVCWKRFHCVLCCNVYYIPHDRHGADGSFQDLRSEYIEKRKAVVKNYLRFSNEKNDLCTAEAGFVGAEFLMKETIGF